MQRKRGAGQVCVEACCRDVCHDATATALQGRCSALQATMRQRWLGVGQAGHKHGTRRVVVVQGARYNTSGLEAPQRETKMKAERMDHGALTRAQRPTCGKAAQWHAGVD
eukprot:CAMPEP_0196660036 /NCGR_PEP_ID=MMETSP1086-20130531/37827_1 /TAXON_ID=77921 /ORGANISM="Cyanoptyche  gloeocystis , Strain SAG4.97" /LENGTH=109 /DNA_ID=CAMNT_0041994267 /DNA_START=185 /DNA_END=514 /DNA_ORIENTATION=-